MICRACSIATLLLVFIAAADSYAEAGGSRGSGYVKLEEVGVEMVKPPGFKVASRFNGFALEAKSASIVAAAIQTPYADMVAGMTDAALQEKGVTVKKREAVKVNGRDATLLYAKQQGPEVVFVKWILLAGDGASTKLITANVPTRFASGLAKRMKASLKSMRFIAMPAEDAPMDVGFTLKSSEKMQLQPQGRGMGKILLYSGEGPPASPDTAVFIATASISPATGTDREQFAVARLGKLGKVRGDVVTSKRPIKIDGLEGFEVIADGEDVESEAPLVIYEAILFLDDGNYYLMVGIIGKKRAAEYLPEFKAMARTFERTS